MCCCILLGLCSCWTPAWSPFLYIDVSVPIIYVFVYKVASVQSQSVSEVLLISCFNVFRFRFSARLFSSSFWESCLFPAKVSFSLRLLQSFYLWGHLSIIIFFHVLLNFIAHFFPKISIVRLILGWAWVSMLFLFSFPLSRLQYLSGRIRSGSDVRLESSRSVPALDNEMVYSDIWWVWNREHQSNPCPPSALSPFSGCFVGACLFGV